MGFQINQVTVSGNLTREPEVRNLPSGTSVTSFSIAHNERRKNQQTDQWEDRAHFFDITMFGAQGEFLAKNLAKGDPITVAGQLRHETWEDKNGGGKRSRVSILARDVVTPQRGGGGGGQQQGGQGGGYGGGQQQGGQQQGGYNQGGSDVAVDTSDFAPAPRGGLSDPGEDDIPF